MNNEKSRKTRYDKGSIKANDRDILTLTWVAQQYAARFDDVHELLGRHPGANVNEEGLSESAVRQVIARWRRAGWIGYQQLLAGSHRGYGLPNMGYKYSVSHNTPPRPQHSLVFAT